MTERGSKTYLQLNFASAGRKYLLVLRILRVAGRYRDREHHDIVATPIETQARPHARISGTAAM